MENSIETLNLDVRAYNYFKREGINTIEELREHIRTKRDHAPNHCAEGEKVCESCRQKLLKSLEKANQASKNSTNKHSWHSTNKKLFNGDKNAN